MRIGILSFPNSVSYGAELQLYALYRSVRKLGYDPEVINYHNSYMKAERHLAKNGGKMSLKDKAKKAFGKMLHLPLYKKITAFEKKNLTCYPKKAFQDKDQLCKVGLRYDGVICGSDQVWNPDITDSDLSYFLDFCTDKTRRISYAPSFGVEEFTDEFSKNIKNELDKFHSVSVREAQGQEFLQKLLQKPVPLVVDPTLLMNNDEWATMEEEFKVDGDYILYYTIRNSKTLKDFCMNLSKKTGLKVVIVGGNFIQKIRNKTVEYACDITPNQWLYLIHNAKYVVTNSFHGTAFSINYRKDFYVEFSSYTNSRLEHITRILGLEDRRLENVQEILPIDYTRTNEILPALQSESMNYLKNALDFSN